MADDAIIEEDPVPGMVSIFVSSSEEDRQILQNALNVLYSDRGVIFARKISVLVTFLWNSPATGLRAISRRSPRGL